MKAFRGKRLYDQVIVTILDKECGWKPEQNITWHLCREDRLIRANDKGRVLNRCNNLSRCKDCKYDHTCQQRIFEKANVYFLQNFLSHVKEEEEAYFLKKMNTCFEQAKKGAVFVIMDLSYKNSLRLMRGLDEQKSHMKTLGTNIYQSIGPATLMCPYTLPYELRENIFTGENLLKPKIKTRYYYLVLQKC